MLGPLYMELEVASRDQGQFFTPPEVSEMMARLQGIDRLLDEGRPFITLSEPAYGAGGMVLAVVKTLIGAKRDPAQTLWVQAWDIDRLAALMAYVRLSLWNVPAEIVVGNTLSLEVREVWHTPAHHLGFWSTKLAAEPRLTPKADEEPAPVTAQSAEAPKAEQAAKPLDHPTQLSFDL
ncbi:SAM-dependent DNA methyltransferase [Rhodobacteraceae bacterium CCMM004]|nr:SAM-dependent DNA methyltransferase [Rhodobacteraceae bacterium CCMM004]